MSRLHIDKTKQVANIVLSLVILITGLPVEGLCNNAYATQKVSSGSVNEYDYNDDISEEYVTSDLEDAATVSADEIESITDNDIIEDKLEGDKFSYKNPVRNEDGTITYDCVWFGKYWQNDTNGDGKADENDRKQPIKWRILSYSNDDLFLMADKLVDVRGYHHSYAKVYWYKCDIRNWLNGYSKIENSNGNDYSTKGFFVDAFTESEAEDIKVTSVVNGGYDDITTNDKVYLLSYRESLDSDYGFSTDESFEDAARIASPTDFSIERANSYCDYEYESSGCEDWWLRSCRGDEHYACVVTNWGRGGYGTQVQSVLTYVRPVLHISSSSQYIQYAGTISSDGTVNEIDPPNSEDYSTLNISFNDKILTLKNWDINNLVTSEQNVVTEEAVAALALSEASYHSADAVDSMLLDLQLIDEINDWSRWQYAYNANGVAHTFSIRQYKGRNFITVVVRGTNGLDLEKLELEDLITVDLSPFGFQRTTGEILSDLETFLSDRGIDKNDTNNVFFITGHSMGGAVAGDMAKIIETTWETKASQINCYTYAAPYNIYDYVDYTMNNNQWYFIHNICNKEDVVPYLPLAQLGVLIKARWGRDFRYSQSWSSSFRQWYNYLTGDDSWYPVPSGLIQHDCKVYMALVLSESNSRIFNYREAIVRCPVDVSVLNGDGEEVASIVNNAVVKHDDNNIVLATLDDEKVIVFLNEDSDYRLILTGTDTGTMTYEIADINSTDASNVVSYTTKTFEKVALSNGKRMSSDLATEISTDDVKLYVVDNDDKPTKEVLVNGKESNYKEGEDNSDNQNDTDDDGIKDGDLPAGEEVPDGVWVGGLKKSYPYTGNAIKPDVRVYYQSRRLTEGLDYTLSYKKNKAVGTGASVTVKCKGDFKGSKTVNFAIEKNPLTTASFEENNLTAAYDGKKHNNIKPILMMDGKKLKYSKKDFDYKYLDAAGQESECKEAGSYTVRMTAKSTSKGYSGSIDVPFTVTDKTAMSKVTVTASKKSLPYNGEKQIPTFTLKYNKKPLAAGSYTMVELDGDDYTAPGNHTVIFRGNGTDVLGSRRYTYKITGKKTLGNKLTAAAITASSLDTDGKVPYAYGGAKPKLKISYNGITLKEGRDYTLSYAANKTVGSQGTVTAKGKGNYTGSVPVNFTVSQRSLDSMLLTVADRAESNKADDYKKTMILFTDSDYTDQKLKADKDYTAEFTVSSGNAKPAVGETVTVLIKARDGGNYTGQVTASFKIIEKTKDISRAKVKVNGGKAYEYTGKAIMPAGNDLTITLDGKAVNTGDYEIAACYNNVKRSSSAVLIIRGKEGLSGMKAVKFKIGVSPLEKLWKGLIGG